MRKRRQAAAANGVEDELRRRGLRLRFRFRCKDLESRYQSEAREAARLHNRVVTFSSVALVDLFYLPVPAIEPEVSVLSAINRFAILTPLWVIYAFLDWRGWLGRWCQAAAASLVVLALLMMALEIALITSPNTAADIGDTPLIELIVLTARLNVRQVAAVTSFGSLSYILAITHCAAIPSYMLSDKILTSLTISSTLLAFALRVDLRERQVFLLRLQAEQNSAALAEKNRALAKLTELDALTGLGNRRCFDEALAAAWRDPGTAGSSLSLVLFDIDHFKAYNDTLGHLAGDACLRLVAAALTACVREGVDTLARYGGEEFAVILPNTGLLDAAWVAERLRAVVADCGIPHRASETAAFVTVSLGVACLPAGVGLQDRLISEADRWLYEAKRNGRNRVASAADVAALARLS